MNRGDFVFFKPRKTNLFQRLIKYFDGKYFHCGIMLSKDLVLSMTRQGIKIENIKDYNGCEIDVFELIDKSKIEELIKFYLSCFEFKYDFWGVLNFIFKKISERPSRFYCSEFLVLGLFYIGYLPEKLQLSPLQLSNQDFFIFKELTYVNS